MKVAIIGAGIAGLSCAIELERIGIQPIIYEQKHRIGSPSPFAPVLLNFIFRPIKDPWQELKENYGIEIKTISPINLLHIQGPNTSFEVGGNLGYTILRGQEKASIESQLAMRLKSPIRFESPIKPVDLIKDVDYLVIADGNKDYAKELGIWHSTFRSWSRGATILGRFDPAKIQIWFNTRYANSGFAYLAPMGTDRASLILNVAYQDQSDLAKFWKTFIDVESINPDTVMHWDIDQEFGLVFPHRVGNTFFVGNSGGFVSSWLGEGLFSCIVSGVEAARAIAKGSNFEKSIRPFYKIMERQARLRYLWDSLNNRGIDWVLKAMGSPALKHPLYHTNLNVWRALDPLIKYWADQFTENQNPIH